MTIDHNKTLFDTTLCITYLELIITDSKAPYVIERRYIRYEWWCGVINTIPSSRGDWQFKYNSFPSSNWRGRELIVSSATKSLGLILKKN